MWTLSAFRLGSLTQSSFVKNPSLTIKVNGRPRCQFDFCAERRGSSTARNSHGRTRRWVCESTRERVEAAGVRSPQKKDGARRSRVHRLPHPPIIHRRVDHRRGDRPVPQRLLHQGDVVGPLKELGGEGVPQGVRRGRAGDPCDGEPVREATVGMPRGDREKPSLRPPVEERSQDLGHGVVDLFGAVALRAAEQDLAAVEVEIRDVERERRAEADAGPEQEVDQSAIPRIGDRGQEAGDVLVGQSLRQRAAAERRADEAGVVLRGPAGGMGEAEELAEARS